MKTRLTLLATAMGALAVLAACVDGHTPATRLPAAETRVAALPFTGAPQVMAPGRSNLDMARDYEDLVFRLESGREVPVLSRFEGPITVALTGPVPPTAGPDLDRLLARLRAEAGIDIRRAGAGQAAITVEFLPRRRMQALVPKAACFVAPRVSDWREYRARRRSDIVDWTTLALRDRAAVFIPSDTTPQEVRDCLHEEIAQALGPLNDLYGLPDSVFNDDNFHTVLTGFDMLMLRTHYAPELFNGMPRAEVMARVPAILDRLNPAGAGHGGSYAGPTPPAFGAAIERALGPRAMAAGRRSAARQAVAIAESAGWRDVRAGFAWFIYGRLSLAADLEAAHQAFLTAEAIFADLPGTDLQRAHVALQLAAFDLSTGDLTAAGERAARALPAAAAAESASLTAMLMMVRAEALEASGRSAEARQVRLDSLRWARYGFGSEAEARRRLADIAGLAAHRRIVRQ